MEREIGPRLGWTSSLTTLLKNGAYCLNGSGHAADKGVAVLEQLTRQSDLLRLTLLPWCAVFAQRTLLRVTHAWCPHCYEEWREHGTPIYDPLIWAVAAVTVCADHRRRLATQCPHCGADRQAGLTSWSQPGRCGCCAGWLGSTTTCAATSDEEQWIAEAVGELLATAGGEPLPRSALVGAFGHCLDQCTQGNVAAFAALLRRPRNTVWLWCAGQVIPSLPMLLVLCRRLGVTPRQFLSADAPLTEIPAPLGDARSDPSRVTRKAPVPFDRQTVRATLERVLDKEDASPSTREVARQVGCDRGVLYHQFPTLCRRIAARSRVAAAQRREQRVRLLCRSVEAIVFALHDNGMVPTRCMVEAHLVTPGILRDPAVRNALNAARAACSGDRKIE